MQQAVGNGASGDRRHADPIDMSSDDLLRAADGRDGFEARAIATGYLMAIRDADADCLSASTLLEYLRCDTGSVLELTGVGYVMAVRDCMRSPAGGRPRPLSSSEKVGMRNDAGHVRDWLERQPRSVIQPAIASVQLALAVPASAAAARAPGLAGPKAALRWFGAQSRVTKGLAAMAAALSVALVLQTLPAPGSDSQRARHDMMVSHEAENIMAMLLEQRRYEKDTILNLSDPVQSEAYAQKWKDSRIALMSTLDALGALDLPAEDRQSVTEIRDDLRFYEQGYLQVLSRMQSGQVRTPQDANRLLEGYKPAVHRVEANGVRFAARALQRAQLR